VKFRTSLPLAQCYVFLKMMKHAKTTIAGARLEEDVACARVVTAGHWSTQMTDRC
jgi:hypothetical protein